MPSTGLQECGGEVCEQGGRTRPVRRSQLFIEPVPLFLSPLRGWASMPGGSWGWTFLLPRSVWL